MSRQKGQPATEEDKFKVKQEIVDTIARICTEDAGTCCFGYCKLNNSCAKPYYTVSDLDYKAKGLNSILNNAKRKERKKMGTTIPPPIKKEKRKAPVVTNKPKSKSKIYKQHRYALFRCMEILGEKIHEHELVKGHEATISKIDKCTSVGQVVKILQDRHYELHGKILNLPKGRHYYWLHSENDKILNDEL